MSSDIELKAGQFTSDPRLDRIVEFDDRSKTFPMGEVLRTGTTTRRSKVWERGPILDQGRDGACVGFGWSAELQAKPYVVKGVSNDTAILYYKRAQQLDEWPGEAYSGSSVLAGAKVAQEKHDVNEYRWCVGDEFMDDVVLTLGNHGPIVFGVKWRQSMFQPRPSGLLEIGDQVAGGHCICGIGVLLAFELPGEPGRHDVIALQQSWGNGWGAGGICYAKIEDWERLLKDEGESCVPLHRHWGQA